MAAVSAPKRARMEVTAMTTEPAVDERALASPVLFTGVTSRPRMMLLPVRKPKAALRTPTDATAMVVAKPPVMTNLDDYLTLVGNMYYQVPEAGKSTGSFAVLRRTTLGVLLSPIREPTVLDRWSPYEIALFESAICLYGKAFGHIAAVVKSKSVSEVIEFYYMWKKSKNYAQWKATYRAQYPDAE